jgi:tetratricopeptide (TPR) repeat protein
MKRKDDGAEPRFTCRLSNSPTEACSQQSDIYSLGISLYQVVSGGKLPFTPRPPIEATPRERARYLEELRAMQEHAVPSQLDTPFWPVIERCLRKDPKHRFIDVAEFRAALTKAARDVRIAVPGKPAVEEDFWTFRTKAKTLMRLEKFEEAIEAFDAFLQILPDEQVILDKAVCLFHLKRFEEAAQIYEYLLSKKSFVFEATWNATDTYRLLGQHDKAIEYASRAVETKSQDWSCWLLLGNARYSRAVAREERGEGKAARDDFVEAVAALRRAVQLAPNSPAAHHKLAMSRLEIEDLEGAKRTFERYLQLAGPDDPNRQAKPRKSCSTR